MLEFLIKYKFIILFYLLVILFLLWKRKKLAVQAKFIILYRMKWGLKWMDTCSKKLREWIVLLGYIGVGAGYVGLIFISYILIKNLYDLATSPDAVSGVSLVLPGINVPGLGVLPFWYWLSAIFVIALVHEFAHGIVARAHNLEVKHTGIVFFGPILGAFVEPNEQKLRKEKDIVQYSVLAAGSFANILLAIAAVILLSLVTFPLYQNMTTPTGFTFSSYVEGDHPFASAEIPAGTIITGIDGMKKGSFQEFAEELSFHRPGETIEVKTASGESHLITLAANPDDPKKPFLGISNIQNEFDIKPAFEAGAGKAAYIAVNWLNGFLRWLFLLSLGIGLFNLLPLPIVDGGRMAQVFLHKLKGPIVGEKRYRQVAMFFLLILLLNLFWPLLERLL